MTDNKTPSPSTHLEGKEPALDWSNFDGPKRNVDWKPDDQDLIYTALNYRDDDYGDADEDVGQQLVERLLSAWNRAAVSEQITFEIAARLLKERDAAEKARPVRLKPLEWKELVKQDRKIEVADTVLGRWEIWQFPGGGTYIMKPGEHQGTPFEDSYDEAKAHMERAYQRRIAPAVATTEGE
ncbi:MAG: hypothetical protein EON58_03945 [Alphaproteobacteria bacterium]|nr:MAG: hypothetical protein EON58_03945 [Alphaproteobacteria bacterium]